MKMKKFMNAPETVTDEELVGLGLAYPDILNVDGHLVISKDLANADRVTIVTYGGSGHEPAQAGFVGKGMLDIQAVGDIFAAPNGQLVFDAMKMADKGHGVLLLTLNYAGDQLAGKQAMKLARKAGLNVRQVVTGEEIRYDPNGEDNKRGLAGAVALYHIAAAAAREGKTLEEVAEIAQHYADNMASITVKSTDATHPQNGMSFGDLGETDLMEIGAGQHGEGGGVRVPMMSSKDTVATVAEALCKALDLKPGDKTFVMINGCGATTMMEMLVLFKDTVEFLKAKGIEVVASLLVLLRRMRRMPCEPEKQGVKLPLFHMVAVKRIAQIGLPSMLQQSLVSLSMMMMQGLVNSFGKVLVAGYTAATKIDSLAMLPNMNISNAMSSFTAQNIGAGKYERVKEGLKACLLMVAVFSLLITVIIFLFGNQLLSLFLDPGDASGAMGYGLAYMHTVSLFYILMGLLFVPNGMLRGAGDMAAFTFSSMANLFSRVGIAYALVYLTPLGANAIWWSIPAGWLIGAAVSLLRVKSGKWMRKAVADR